MFAGTSASLAGSVFSVFSSQTVEDQIRFIFPVDGLYLPDDGV